MTKIEEGLIHPVRKKERLQSLPAEWADELLPEIQARVAASRRKVVVLDDDPTGTQTVHGIPVLTTWEVDDLLSELHSPHPAFYILTNSRSLPLSEAQALNREIGLNLSAAAGQSGVGIEIISRSDSTLRGHFPGEVKALAASLGYAQIPCLIVPFFLEGGRYTIDDVHFVADGDQLVPAAQTPYARDAAFGYHNSNLRLWVEEKSAGLIPADEVNSISLGMIRQGGPREVERALMSLKRDSVCVVNAASYRDLEVFVLGLLAAEDGGGRYLLRTAASIVRVRAGIAPRPLLDRKELRASSSQGGLFLVGSHVPISTAQIAALQSGSGIASIEVDVLQLLNADQQAQEIETYARTASHLIEQGRNVLMYTSRELVTAKDAGGSLDIGQRVSASLVAILQRISVRPRYLVAKGGITASDLATRALNVRRALILGQVLPGVPVWRLGDESRFPAMPYIVFPGNVGDSDSLLEIFRIMK